MKAAILAGYDKNGCALEVRDIPVPQPAARDGVFGLGDVNAALAKVAAGGSKGKTVLRLN